mmetsp:Transcript_44802/g.66473  ORF Transcript_44802/g.66473 Transcript_44802/m.66473 type:complete len:186 (-) Transcript_44802:243-800(-)
MDEFGLTVPGQVSWNTVASLETGEPRSDGNSGETKGVETNISQHGSIQSGRSGGKRKCLRGSGVGPGISRWRRSREGLLDRVENVVLMMVCAQKQENERIGRKKENNSESPISLIVSRSQSQHRNAERCTDKSVKRHRKKKSRKRDPRRICSHRLLKTNTTVSPYLFEWHQPLVKPTEKTSPKKQ